LLLNITQTTNPAVLKVPQIQKRMILAIILIFSGYNLCLAQTGGTRVYRFLDLPYSSRVAALGGKIASMPSENLSFAMANPSLLSSVLVNNLTINYISYFGGIHFGSVSYAFRAFIPGRFAAGLQYVSYGSFTAADEAGIITGTFSASEYVFHLTYAYSPDSSFTLGINVKPLLSVLERYQSFGLVADIGASYHNRDGLFTAGFVLRNMGVQLRPYVKGHHEPVPFEIRAGVTQKLRYAPLRFIFTLQQLQQPDLLYPQASDPESPQNSFSPDTEKELHGISRLTENAMRHVLLGIEFLPLKNVIFSAGYNYQRRKELGLTTRMGTIGFSWGITIRLSRFHISYARATYHLAGASNHFSVTTNLHDFFPGRNE